MRKAFAYDTITLIHQTGAAYNEPTCTNPILYNACSAYKMYLEVCGLALMGSGAPFRVIVSVPLIKRAASVNFSDAVNRARSTA
jgi:hypothetical protein